FLPRTQPTELYPYMTYPTITVAKRGRNNQPPAQTRFLPFTTHIVLQKNNMEKLWFSQKNVWFQNESWDFVNFC
ncbi:MAG: hypothetical protein IKV45_01385, partial [Firmicutes bacterium]|nr:hypothetical protein [Bacillota bacterium]